MDIDTKYDISEIEEASRLFDNDLIRKTNMLIDDVLELLEDDQNKQDTFHKGIQIIKSKIKKDISFDELAKVIDGWEYTLSIIFDDYNILIHDNLKVAPYTSNLEFLFCIEVDKKKYTITKVYNLSEFSEIERTSHIFFDIIMSIHRKIKSIKSSNKSCRQW